MRRGPAVLDPVYDIRTHFTERNAHKVENFWYSIVCLAANLLCKFKNASYCSRFLSTGVNLKKKINRPESWTHREHERLRHIHKNFTILDLWHEKGLSLPCLCKAEDKSVTGLVASQRMGHCSIYRTASFTQIGKLAMMPALSLVQV
jgi:hypothetical protein